jgi:uncharacterized membrane protein YecN with MAPEG domain
LKVTLLYGGLCALLVTLLGINVSLRRMFGRIYVGAELPKRMQMKVRAHGNAAEWVPLGILLLWLLESNGVSSLWLHVLGGTFLFGRLLHAVGFLARLPVSFIGATINYGALLAMSGTAIWLHFR